MIRLPWLQPSSYHLGVVFKILSCVAFAVYNTLLKGISLPPTQIAAMQSLGAAAMMGFWISKTMTLRDIRPLLPFLVLRSAVATIGVVCWTCAIQRMGLFQSVSMGFIGPFFSAIGAYIFLKDHLSRRRILSIIVAAVSMVFFFYPKEEGGTVLWQWLPVAASLAFSAVDIMGKRLMHRLPPITVTFFLLLFNALALCTQSYSWIQPSLAQGFLAIALAVLTATAYLSLHWAIRYKEVSFLIPFEGVRVLLAFLLGWAFFQEYPEWNVWVGALLVLLAIYILSRETPKNRDMALKEASTHPRPDSRADRL